MKVLYGLRTGAEDWQEEIITTDESRIEAAKAWARANGFDRFRVAEHPDEPDRPDFTKVLRNTSAENKVDQKAILRKAKKNARADGYDPSDDWHEWVDAVLDSANALMGGFGIESIQGDNWDPYYQDIVLLYVNMGDTYDATILYDVVAEKFRIGSWGDFVERMAS